ncbi:MAG: HEAT repeat domain-containing protein [Dehalococcoidia bacterium]|nr:HEAT repeat domain-containing protein [Dehalococcoidia bacterium]
MSAATRGLTGLDAEALACLSGGGLALALAGREAFVLPGDQPVWGRDRPIDVQHVRLELSFDLARRSLAGVCTTTLRPRMDGLREAVFDAKELAIDAVEDETGRALPFTIGEHSLRIDLGRARSARRTLTVVVRYHATPRRGLYFNAPDAGYPDRPTQIWTQGQPEDSPYWFPCFDYPGEKFTTELLATVPAGWFALSNGRLESRTEQARAKTSTFHWVQDVPHPAYLVTLAAAEFDVIEADDVDGAPIQYLGPKGSGADLRRAFGRTPEMVRHFASKIGVAYPFAKYATVAIHDFTFGGMENTSATTMTDAILHDERAHEDFFEAADGITAHELAHQWFGDLLTCREWAHGWLNESFATYFDALWIEHDRGHDDFRYEILQDARAYLAEDSGAYRRPMVQNVYHGPIDIFDRHLYERGAVILDMLRTELGEEAWWAAIRHYVQAHRGRDVVTHDFQRAIEAATGRNVDWFFNQWVWRGGHPEFKASYAWDAANRLATITLSQQQRADDALTSVYRVPLEIVAMTSRGLQRFTVQVTEASHSFVLPLDAEPRWVAIDPAYRVLRTLDFAPGEAQLKARLTEDPEAVGRIEAAKGLGKLASPGAIEALRAALLDEAQPAIVRAEIAGALVDTKAEAARDALVEGIGAAPSRVRRAVAAALGGYRDEVAAKALTTLLAGRGDRSYYVQSAAAAALGATRQPSAFDALTKVLGRPAHNDVITAAALGGLAALRDTRAIDTLVEYTQWGRHQSARRAATEALGRLGPFAEEPVRLRVRERLEELLDDRSLRVQLAATDALAALGDARAIGALGAAGGRALEGRLTRNTRVAARALGQRADKGAEVQALKTDLEKLQQENQGLKDRLTKIEAQLTPGGPASTSAHGAGRAKSPARRATAASTGNGRRARGARA